MKEQPPNPSDFAELRQIYAGLSDDKITPALDYINEKGQLQRGQMPLPVGSNSEGGLELPNYIIGAKVNNYTTRELYKKPEDKNKKDTTKAPKQ